MTKTYEEAYEMMEKLTSNHYQMDNNRTSRRQGGLIELDALTTLSAQLASLTKQVQNIGMTANINAIQNPSTKCNWCGEAHLMEQCPSNPESINYIRNFNRGSK